LENSPFKEHAVQPTARFNKKGFTFVEVLVAIVILLISMVGILEAMVLAMQQNMETFSRDEAIRIGEQAMNEARNIAFGSLANTNYNVTRTYKQFSKTFTVNRTITQLSTDSLSIQVQVGWTINRKTHSHCVTSIMSRGI
jgi:prepilin-type N-terminal cleavage/methylation domain-containing protein